MVITGALTELCLTTATSHLLLVFVLTQVLRGNASPIVYITSAHLTKVTFTTLYIQYIHPRVYLQ